MKQIFLFFLCALAILLTAFAVDRSYGGPVICYLEHINAGLATLIAGLLGFAGLGSVAWFNSQQDRIARTEERRQNGIENANIIYSDIVYLTDVYAYLDTFTLTDQINTNSIRNFFGYNANHVEFGTIRFSDKIEVLRGIPHDVIVHMGKIKEVDRRVRFQFTREDPVTDAGGEKNLVQSWRNQNTAFFQLAVKICRSLTDEFETQFLIPGINLEDPIQPKVSTKNTL